MWNKKPRNRNATLLVKDQNTLNALIAGIQGGVAMDDDVIQLDESVFALNGYQHQAWAPPNKNITIDGG